MFNFKKKGRKKNGICVGKLPLQFIKPRRGRKEGAVINFPPFAVRLRTACMKNTCKFIHSNVIIFSQQYSFASKLISEICFLFF